MERMELNGWEEKEAEPCVRVELEIAVLRQPQSLQLQLFLISSTKELHPSLQYQFGAGKAMFASNILDRDTAAMDEFAAHNSQVETTISSESQSGMRGIFENWLGSSMSLMANKISSSGIRGFGFGTAGNWIIRAISSAEDTAALNLVGNFQLPGVRDEVITLTPTPATLAPPNATQIRPCSMLDVAQRISQVDQPNSNNDADTERRQSRASSIPHISNQIRTSLSSSPHVLAGDTQTLEADAFPVCTSGEQSSRNENLFSPAFRKDPELREMQSLLTESLSSLSPSRPSAQDLAGTPVRQNAELVQSSESSAPPSETSLMEFIPCAALRSRTQRSL